MASAQIAAAWAAAQQDALRSQRQFLAAAGTSDQTYAGQDGSATNPAGQFLANGPAGAAIEGKPISQAQRASLNSSTLKRWAIPALLLLLLLRR